MVYLKKIEYLPDLQDLINEHEDKNDDEEDNNESPSTIFEIYSSKQDAGNLSDEPDGGVVGQSLTGETPANKDRYALLTVCPDRTANATYIQRQFFFWQHDETSQAINPKQASSGLVDQMCVFR
ncbi:hypothetical protein TNCV_3885791 [Trichonephila clavipes]|nr:hypothetical protein TNCV_3885791 [Trichonephila clavipes]